LHQRRTGKWDDRLEIQLQLRAVLDNDTMSLDRWWAQCGMDFSRGLLSQKHMCPTLDANRTLQLIAAEKTGRAVHQNQMRPWMPGIQNSRNFERYFAVPLLQDCLPVLRGKRQIHAGTPANLSERNRHSTLTLKKKIVAYPVDNIFDTGTGLQIGKDERLGATH